MLLPSPHLLSRRHFIGAAASTVVVPTASALGWQSDTLLTPEMFGARGDGRSDDYPALTRLAAAASGSAGAVVRFGRRQRYLIDRMRIVGGPDRNTVSDIAFTDCRGLTVDLNGATIDVRGDFHRGGDDRNGRRSYTNAVIPLSFARCVGVRIENGILNGNAERMTRDARVAEGPGHGIAFYGCDRVVLEHLHIHHFSTDGVVIRAWSGGRPSREVTLRQVRLTNNGRQGLTNAGAIGVEAFDCDFSETGLTGGDYRHAPSAGVDVEPHPGEATRSDFRAVNCRFDNNRGAPVVAGSPDLARALELENCSGRCDSMRRMILSAERTVIRGGRWHNVQIACAYAAHRPFEHAISIDVSGGLWTGDDPAWAPVYDLNGKHPEVRIHDNRFELRSPRPFAPSSLFQVDNPNHRFEENRIFVAASGHAGDGDDLIGRFGGGARVRGNSWSTDAAAPRRFVNDYSRAARAEGERFEGGFAGIGLR